MSISYRTLGDNGCGLLTFCFRSFELTLVFNEYSASDFSFGVEDFSTLHAKISAYDGEARTPRRTLTPANWQAGQAKVMEFAF